MAKLFLDVRAMRVARVNEDFQNQLEDAKGIMEIMRILRRFSKGMWRQESPVVEEPCRTEKMTGYFQSRGFSVEVVVSLGMRRGKGNSWKGDSLNFLLKCERRDLDRCGKTNRRKKINGGWKREFSLERFGDEKWTELIIFFRKRYNRK